MSFQKNYVRRLVVGVAIALASASAQADEITKSDTEPAWFVGLNSGAAFRFAGSDTTTGGALFSGDVHSIEFDPAFSVGGVVGYRYSPSLAAFLSYDYVDADVEWRARFAGGGNDSAFDGKARSNVILANVRYATQLQPALRLSASLGAGISINQLGDVIENDAVTGAGRAAVDDGTSTGFAARAAVGAEHDLTNAITLQLGASLDYLGGFETGNSRANFGGASEAIGRYELDDTLSAAITGRVVWTF